MLYFAETGIIRIHDFIIKSQGGATGILNPGLIQAAAERPRTLLFSRYEPFRDTIAKASALVVAVTKWHPFIDGNKRTALLSMDLMLGMNGVRFVSAPYMVKYLLLLARGDLSEDGFREVVERLSTRSRLRYWLMNLAKQSVPTTFYKLMVYIPPMRRFAYDRLVDWLGAGDADALDHSLEEYARWSEQGYPKSDVHLDLQDEDLIEE